MRNQLGVRGLCTPSIVWAPEVAMVALDGGDSGYMHVRVDGSMVDFTWFYADLEVAHKESHEWNNPDNHTQRIAEMGTDKPLEFARTMLNFMSACVEASDRESENHGLFPTEVRDWFTDLNIEELLMEINDEIGEA